MNYLSPGTVPGGTSGGRHVEQKPPRIRHQEMRNFQCTNYYKYTSTYFDKMSQEMLPGRRQDRDELQTHQQGDPLGENAVLRASSKAPKADQKDHLAVHANQGF